MTHHILLLTDFEKQNDGLERLLLELGHQVDSHTVNTKVDVVQQIENFRHSLLIYDVKKPKNYFLSEIRSIQDSHPIPIVFFVEESDSYFINEAIDAGSSSFIIDGKEKRRLPNILTAAVARFQKCQNIKKKLIDTERRLEERRDIEKAKGILMRKNGISEDEAYALLRSKAMSKNLRLGDLAKNINLASDLMD